ncbi:hypothetical protein SDRG_15722 [Saprolegnia diclina VS20]|uniref:Uncharacterized protein n=1 Tax=Saprolegnia diclina (strain VS20) TaxID=1156394 RepID=T0PW18_SAPDV|nr:hypothetical protein SDRG_15722 [Saprolegnia diclina VS20]EQC26441.1 hypothetical protein SDRG_15722 [Saprolegnia diclina VS20]|eukprot:XP_008620126.1 hypothetical protein SDRG_15722 [Saprolegnia diclina VS20]
MTVVKRTCPAASSVLEVRSALLSVAQCLASPIDVAAFLSALPATSLDAPLTALRELLTRPGPFSFEWPTPDLDVVTESDRTLVRIALPALVSVRAQGVKVFARLFNRPAATHAIKCLDHFAQRFATKLTQLHLDATLTYSDAFCVLLSRCTHLESIRLAASGSNVLTAVTTPNHRVRSIRLEMELVKTTPRWTPLLTKWLSSGFASRVKVHTPLIADVDDLALAIATTPSLRALFVHHSDAILHALLATRRALSQIIELRVVTDETDLIPRLLQLVDHSAMKVLEFLGAADFSYILALLPQLPSLHELSLHYCTLGAMPLDTSTWPQLRTASFEGVKFEANTFDALLAYLVRATHLTEVVLNGCALVAAKIDLLSRALPQWMQQGLTYLSLVDNQLDNRSAALLAIGLREGRNVAPLTVHLHGNSLDVHGVRMLLDALATCECVRIQLNLDESVLAPCAKELHALAAARRMRVDLLDDDGIQVLYSPIKVVE